ncbi:MAG: O-antigen ligase family protein [Terriglobia bacterium]
MVPPAWLKHASLWLAMASVVSILLGVAVSQNLLALALCALLLSGLPLRWPRIAFPLALFMLWTLVALAFSPDPRFGLAQIRKFYVFSTMLIVFSNITTLARAKWLTLAWMVVGTFTAGRGIFQYARDIVRWQATGEHIDFYHFYIADRIRGFMSHWMTFSGQELYILLLLAAFLLFAPGVRKYLWLLIPCAAVTGLALVFSKTRGVWVAAVFTGFYLLWCWNRWAALAMPVVLALGLLAGPSSVRERVVSIWQPHGQTDSNLHREITRRVGWQMIKAHPLVGVGPDEIIKEPVFSAYLPGDITRPLPDGYYGHLHNIYIQYAAERGLPAAIFITGALLMALVDFGRALRRAPPGRSDVRFLLQASIACVLGTMIVGLVEYNLNDTEVLTMFLAIMCLGYLGVARAACDETAG